MCRPKHAVVNENPLYTCTMSMHSHDSSILLRKSSVHYVCTGSDCCVWKSALQMYSVYGLKIIQACCCGWKSAFLWQSTEWIVHILLLSLCWTVYFLFVHVFACMLCRNVSNSIFFLLKKAFFPEIPTVKEISETENLKMQTDCSLNHQLPQQL